MKEEIKRIKQGVDAEAGETVTLHIRIPELWYRQLVGLSKRRVRSAHGQAVVAIRDMLDNAGYSRTPEPEPKPETETEIGTEVAE